MKQPIALILALAFSLSATGAAAQEFVYTDASTLPVYGKICEDTSGPFSRLPKRLEGISRKEVTNLGRCSAGVFVRFASDAGVFNLKWTNTNGNCMSNMALCGSRGLALYVLDGKEWVYVGTGRPELDKKSAEYKIACSKLKGTMSEFMLYMSLYSGVTALEIGIPEGSTIKASTLDSPRKEKPVIMYGTSILQGASASHPGLCSTNLLSRRLDRVVMNLGFSGNALLDMEIAELMAAYPDPGVFVLDNVPNGSPELTREKEEQFFRILRNAHPTVPIIFVECAAYPGVRFDKAREALVANRNKALKEVYDRIVKSGEKNVYYVKGNKLLRKDNVGTIEGTHFTDIGFEEYVKVLQPVIEKALKSNRK